MITKEKTNGTHSANQTKRGYKRTVMVWHSHVNSCMIHEYNPITGCTLRVDVHNPSSKSNKKQKSRFATY
jgi:hypothetical protein